MRFFLFFHCICHFFMYENHRFLYSFFSLFHVSLPIFLTWMGKPIHFSEVCLYFSARLKTLFWLNLLFWLLSIHFLLCWTIRLHMLFFDPKKLSFTWCVQVSGNLNMTLIDIYDRYLTATISSGAFPCFQVQDPVKLLYLPEYCLTSVFIYSCPYS